MSATALDIEMLAEMLAELYARDPVILEYMPEFTVDDLTDGVVLGAYEDGLIDGALDRIAEIERLASLPRRPRSPIEMMIDRACGIEVLPDGTIVELKGPRR